MLDYLPTDENNEDTSRSDQATWNLVGCQPVILNYHQMLKSYWEWERSIESIDASKKLEEILTLIERETYDRLSQPYYRPSEEARLFCGVK